MSESDMNRLLQELTRLPSEAEWVEFKCDNEKPEAIGEYLSALSNSAALLHVARGYIVWGVTDEKHEVVGTTFNPRRRKVGNENLESWLSHLLHPRVDFRIHEFSHEGKPIVLFEVPPATHTPVRFRDAEFIRVGSYKKNLRDYPEKERALWAIFRKESFEAGVAAQNMSAADVLTMIDYPSFFRLLQQPLPDNRQSIIERLLHEKIIAKGTGETFIVTNLGAILFAVQLGRFDGLARKSPRVVLYRGVDRTQTIKEHVTPKGCAAGFEELVQYIDDQLPRSEELGKSLRKDVRTYPQVAVRELVANAIIHQDFSLTGTGPMVEVFEDRIEITNPGVPLIDTLRFIDEPPQSRNEALAALMRRMNVCEERGSGIDKVISQVELYQLPAPDFQVTANHTKAVLYAPKRLAQMNAEDRIRACYQHACLCYVSNKAMTNGSLRQRFGIEKANAAVASRIINETVVAHMVKRADPQSKSKKHARYLPFWG